MPFPTIFSVHHTKSKESISQKTEAFLGLRDAPYISDFLVLATVAQSQLR